MNYLSQNETAYEEHRSWRVEFNPLKQSSILLRTWPCSICYWAQEKYRKGLIMNGNKKCY
jgi:hypothetical protein